jgi:hypothetical protein
MDFVLTFLPAFVPPEGAASASEALIATRDVSMLRERIIDEVVGERGG